MLHLDPPVLGLLRALAEEGGRGVLVGGCVRDALLGRPLKDLDVEVFGLPARALERKLRQFGRVDAVGRAFGVFKLRLGERELDISVPRRDSKVAPGHRGIHVEGDPSMTFLEAARRRDLTINAISYDPLADELIDPVDGRADLERRLLRAVDPDAFLEDPLRALRVAQFAARLSFHVDPDLITLCRRAPLEELPAERIQGEWQKLLLKADRPSVGLEVARETAVLLRCFPEAAQLQTDAAIDRAATLRDPHETGRAWSLLLATWLHPLPVPAVERTLDRLWLHKVQGHPTRATTLALVETLSRPAETLADLRNLAARVELDLALDLRGALGGSVSAARGAAQAAGLGRKAPAPWVQGRDLLRRGVQAGPAMGQALALTYQAQLDGEVRDPDEAMSWCLARLTTAP